jgi:dihydrolipoamide dehydrogenase
MLGHKSAVRYDTIPSVIYTHPEVATVGLTKEQAVEKGYDAVTSMLPMTFSGRYMAENDGGRGVVKVVAEKQFGTILGVHMIGAECSEMIHGAAVMIEAELRVADVRDIVFAHPTTAEVMKDAIMEIKL